MEPDQFQKRLEQSMQEDEMETISHFHNVVNSYIKRGMHATALALCKNEVSRATKLYKSHNYIICAVLSVQAMVLKKCGRFQEALDIMCYVHASRVKLFGPNHLVVGFTHKLLGVHYACVNENDSCELHLREAERILTLHLGGGDYRVGQCIFNRAVALLRCGEPETSLRFFKKAIEICEMRHPECKMASEIWMNSELNHRGDPAKEALALRNAADICRNHICIKCIKSMPEVYRRLGKHQIMLWMSSILSQVNVAKVFGERPLAVSPNSEKPTSISKVN